MGIVERVEIVFRRGDELTVPPKYLGELYLAKYSKEAKRAADNTITETETVGIVAMEVFSEFDGDYEYSFVDNVCTVFDRLKHRDIEKIVLYFEDGTSSSYEVDYDIGENKYLGAENVNEKVYQSDLGNLYIVIDRNADISNHFNMDTINDAWFMKYHKDTILGL